jgi:hypothetical protein
MREEFTLTVAEAAAMLGGSEKAIQRLIYTARLDAIRVKGARGHEFRVRATEVTTRKAELQQRIAEAQSDCVPTATSDAPAEAATVAEPAVAPEKSGSHDASQTASAGWPVPVVATEAIPVGVYQELFRRYDLLGRRAARLECENRHLRDALQRLQTPVETPTASAPRVEELTSADAEPVSHRMPHRTPPAPDSPAPRQLWHSFTDRLPLLGGSRPRR